MTTLFLKKWAFYFLVETALFFIISILFIKPIHGIIWVYAIFLIALIASYQAYNSVVVSLKNKFDEEINDLKVNLKLEEKLRDQAQEETKLWKQSLLEKSAGFPTLLRMIDLFEKLRDEETEQNLRYKKRPAIKGAQVVKEEGRRRRKAEYENRKTHAIIEYYESIAPFLIDFKNDITGIEDEDKYREYDESERLDSATQFLTKEEFRKLTSVERNQMALDRYWKRPKSNWLLGRIYERYVGYLYEEAGYDVEYVGIFKGYEDLGRDLICQKGTEFIIIQCKYWSQFKTIYEKHIFQFFGTVFQYRDENPDRDVRAIFYTSTQLSQLARRFAQELGIELKENFKFDVTYPSIKCNVSRIDRTKIYHLPFDQQYDKVKIEQERGEFYCGSVKEAEKNGFRRAFKYKGG